MFAAGVSDVGAVAVRGPVVEGAVAPVRCARLLGVVRDCEGAVRGHLAALGLLTTVSVVGTLAAPVLWNQPLLLMSLAPRLPFLVLAAATLPLPVFLAVGTARLCLADPVHFDLARRLGHRVGPLLSQRAATGGGRRATLVRRWGRPATALLVLLRPTSNQLRLAAWAGLRGRVTLALSATGTVAYLVAIHLGTGHLT